MPQNQGQPENPVEIQKEKRAARLEAIKELIKLRETFRYNLISELNELQAGIQEAKDKLKEAKDKLEVFIDIYGKEDAFLFDDDNLEGAVEDAQAEYELRKIYFAAESGRVHNTQTQIERILDSIEIYILDKSKQEFWLKNIEASVEDMVEMKALERNGELPKGVAKHMQKIIDRALQADLELSNELHQLSRIGQKSITVGTAPIKKPMTVLKKILRKKDGLKARYFYLQSLSLLFKRENKKFA